MLGATLPFLILCLTSCASSPPIVQTKVVTVTVSNPVPVPTSLTTPRTPPPPPLQSGANGFDLVHQNLLWQQAYAGLVAQLGDIAAWSQKAVQRLRNATTQTSGKPAQ